MSTNNSDLHSEIRTTIPQKLLIQEDFSSKIRNDKKISIRYYSEIHKNMPKNDNFGPSWMYQFDIYKIKFRNP